MMSNKYKTDDRKMMIALTIVTQAITELRERDMTEAEFRARLDELTGNDPEMKTLVAIVLHAALIKRKNGEVQP